MKPLLTCSLVGVAALFALSARAQSYLADPIEEPASNSNFYYENWGQLVDHNGKTRPDILYYTEHTAPSIYLQRGRASFVAYKGGDTTTSTPDSTFRVDMKFVCNLDMPCGEIKPYHQSQDHLNFYLPQCPNGITNVPGYEGVEYDDVVDYTDFHFYSNGTATKCYIRFRPGANPNDLGLQFSGQDSIQALANTLKMYIGSRRIIFPDAVAYQVDASNNIIPVSWQPTWYDAGSNVAKLNVGSYDATKDLIIKFGAPTLSTTAADNLEWSTYYGGDGREDKAVIATSGSNIVHAMQCQTQNFPVQGQNAVSPNQGLRDVYVSKFNSSGVRQWATYYGGSSNEEPWAIESTTSTTNGGGLFVAGQVQSTNLPLGNSSIPGFQQSTHGGGVIDGFVANFSDATGQMFYATYYGGSGLDRIYDISANVTDGVTYLYFCGNTMSTNSAGSSSSPPPAGQFPVYQGSGSRYYQGTPAGANEGFVGSFAVSSFGLDWSTFFGGPQIDELYSIKSFTGTSAADTKLYVSGYTVSPPQGSNYPTSPITSPPSGAFPLVNPSGSFFDALQTGSEGVIACFDNNYKLSWSTYLGGNNGEFIADIATTTSGDVYVTGKTETNLSTLNNQSSAISQQRFPLTYNSATEYGQTYGGGDADAFVARFSASNHSMPWCTYYGGSGFELYYVNTNFPRIAVAGDNTVYMTGFSELSSGNTSGSSPTKTRSGWYNQANNASLNTTGTDARDGYLVQFNPNNSWNWATHFGGALSPKPGSNSPEETITSLATLGTSPTALFMTGFSLSANTPMSPPPPASSGIYHDDSYNGLYDVFISKFASLEPAGIRTVERSNDLSHLVINPNPNSGDFQLLFVFKEAANKHARISVCDVTGRVVLTKEVSVFNGENHYNFSLAEHPAGTYLLTVAAGQSTQSIKVTKQ